MYHKLGKWLPSHIYSAWTETFSVILFYFSGLCNIFPTAWAGAPSSRSILFPQHGAELFSIWPSISLLTCCTSAASIHTLLAASLSLSLSHFLCFFCGLSPSPHRAIPFPNQPVARIHMGSIQWQLTAPSTSSLLHHHHPPALHPPSLPPLFNQYTGTHTHTHTHTHKR